MPEPKSYGGDLDLAFPLLAGSLGQHQSCSLAAPKVRAEEIMSNEILGYLFHLVPDIQQDLHCVIGDQAL
jgi:hypothetical protein